MGIFPMPKHRRQGGRAGRDGGGGVVGQQQPHGGGAVADAELADRLFDVAIHGLGRDLELAADLLGCPVTRGHLQALPLARRQTIEQGGFSGSIHGDNPCRVCPTLASTAQGTTSSNALAQELNIK